jgi:hypothetical protein
MPVFEQGYRRYVGERSTRPRVTSIAWENVRPRLRWWVWVLLFFLLFWPYLIHAVLVFIATLGSGMFGANVVAASGGSEVAFQSLDNFGPEYVLGMLQGNSLSLHWSLLFQSLFAAVVVASVLGAGLLASDRRTGGLQIYFARPVTRFQYLLGKVLACTFFVALTTAIPCLLIWAETVAFGSVANLTWRTFVAPLSILGSSAFYALWTVALVLSLSSVMRRPVLVAIAAMVVYLVLEAVGAILAETLTNGKGWHVIGPSYAVGAVTAPICGLTLPPWINAPLAFGLAVGVPLALLWFVWWRISAVEVAT